MKQVWKCDFCSHTQKMGGSQDYQEMKEHESTCSFNPAMKKCWTCKHSYDTGVDYPVPECDVKLSVLKGQDNGNCPGWEYPKKITMILI